MDQLLTFFLFLVTAEGKDKKTTISILFFIGKGTISVVIMIINKLVPSFWFADYGFCVLGLPKF